MFKYIALGLMALVVIVLILAATRPATFEVRRTTDIAATPEQVFPLINDMRRFNGWNPYARKDPAMHSQFSGPEAGPGARLDFAGNKDVGRGTLQITDSRPPSHVGMELHMIEPFEGRNQAEFDLVPMPGGGTQVTWAMHGASPFIARLVGLFVDMDRMIGRDFEAGLANLKASLESKGNKA